MLTRSLLVVLLFLLSVQAKATHLVGGELYYAQRPGSSTYIINLKLYMDCYYGNPSALESDSTISYVFVKKHLTGELDTVLSNASFQSVQLSSIYTNPCLVEPGDVCVRELLFTYTIDLPPIAGGYDLVFQRCCRNGTIINIVDPGTVGTTLNAYIPGPEMISQNSSPHYKNFPPIFICTQDPVIFDNSVTDDDGDVVRYELCEAYYGADNVEPKPDGVLVPDFPYGPVPYNGSYSGTNPIDGAPAFQVDSITGLLTGTAVQAGQYVVAVCAKEYRNGVLISINRRDFQFNVVNCGAPVAAFPTQQDYCSGFDFSFQNNSYNATGYYWDFGDGTSSTDPNPFHTYTDTGRYTVVLIANNNRPSCTDTVIQTVYAYPKLQPDFTVPPAQCLDGNLYTFTGGGLYAADAVFQWDLGNNAVPSTATGLSSGNVHFTSEGQHTVVLSVTQGICLKQVIGQVLIFPEPRPVLTPPLLECNGDTITVLLSGSATSTNVSYTWNAGLSTAQFVSPPGANSATIVYGDTGVFDVSVIVLNSNGCSDTAFTQVKVYEPFEPVINNVQKQCIEGNLFTFSVGGLFNSQAMFSWDFGTNAAPSTAVGNPVSGITFTGSGYHPVILNGTQNICVASDTLLVYVVAEPTAQIAPQQSYCEGLTFHFENESSGSDAWFWDFGVNSTGQGFSTQQNPSYTYSDTGIYAVQLIASNEGVCFDTTQIQVHILPFISAFFAEPPGQCLGSNLYDFVAAGVYYPGALFGWSFPPNASIDTATTATVNDVSFTASGVYPVTLYIEQFGCLKSYTDTAIVNESPVPVISMGPQEGCAPVTVSFVNGTSTSVPLNYSWSFGDGSTSTEDNPTHVYTQPGQYNVTLVVANVIGCPVPASQTINGLVNVYAIPEAGLLLDSLSKSILEAVFKFSDNSTGAQACYLWFGDGDSSSVCDITHTYKDTGWYNYTQVVISENGCRDTLKGRLRVRPDFVFYIPNTFTPNKDNFNEVFRPVIFGVKNFEFSIFDRWGVEVFTTTETSEGWDGYYRGQAAPIDVYVYKITFRSVFEKDYQYTGRVNLLR